MSLLSRMSMLNVECPKMLLFLPHNAWFDCNYNKIMQLQLNYVSHFLVSTYCFRPVSVSVHFYVQLLFVKCGFLNNLHVCLLPYEDCYCSLIRQFLKELLPFLTNLSKSYRVSERGGDRQLFLCQK